MLSSPQRSRPISLPSLRRNATSMTSWCGASSRCSPLPAAMRKWIWHSPSESTRFMLRGRPSQILAGKLFTVRKQPWRNQKQKRRRKVSPSPFLPRARSLPSGRSVSSPGQTKPPARYTEATLLTAMEHPGGQVQDQKLRRTLEETSGLARCHAGGHHREAVRRLLHRAAGQGNPPHLQGAAAHRLVPPDLKSAALTAQWEQRLRASAKGRKVCPPSS